MVAPNREGRCTGRPKLTLVGMGIEFIRDQNGAGTTLGISGCDIPRMYEPEITSEMQALWGEPE